MNEQNIYLKNKTKELNTPKFPNSNILQPVDVNL